MLFFDDEPPPALTLRAATVLLYLLHVWAAAFLCTHACFCFPSPPNFFLSLQLSHFPQSSFTLHALQVFSLSSEEEEEEEEVAVVVVVVALAEVAALVLLLPLLVEPHFCLCLLSFDLLVA